LGKGPRYRVQYRRRRQQKTDYSSRRKLAVSEFPRFVVRISNKNIIVQIVKSEIEGDYILSQTSSSNLSGFGWMGNKKNTPTAYLIGFLAGKKAQAAGIQKAVLDLGLKRATKGAKVFAVVKGANDSGLDIPIDSDIIPCPEKINGKIIAEFADHIEDPLEYEKKFSDYLRKGLRPEALPNHFEEIKAQLEEIEFEQ
jgi:large subunit ribosomal protein L18